MNESLPIINETIKPIIDYIDRAGSYENVLIGLYDQYPKMKIGKLEKMIASLTFNGVLSGYIQAAEDERYSDNISFAEPRIEIALNMPFETAMDYARQKGYKISAKSWRDVWKEANLHSFTVARVTQMDILTDIRLSMEAAMEQGLTFTTFQRDLIPRLMDKGWWADEGEKPIVRLADGTIRKRLNVNRLGTIYDTNINVATAVGHWQRFEENKINRPYLMYTGINDQVTRERHRRLFGTVWRIDDPMLNTIAPPNGFRCRCRMRSLTEQNMQSMGLKPATVLPDGAQVDEGWDYNPGKKRLSEWTPDLNKYDPSLVRQYRLAA